jgi:hypothetical protein
MSSDQYDTTDARRDLRLILEEGRQSMAVKVIRGWALDGGESERVDVLRTVTCSNTSVNI